MPTIKHVFFALSVYEGDLQKRVELTDMFGICWDMFGGIQCDMLGAFLGGCWCYIGRLLDSSEIFGDKTSHLHWSYNSKSLGDGLHWRSNFDTREFNAHDLVCSGSFRNKIRFAKTIRVWAYGSAVWLEICKFRPGSGMFLDFQGKAKDNNDDEQHEKSRVWISYIVFFYAFAFYTTAPHPF